MKYILLTAPVVGIIAAMIFLSSAYEDKIIDYVESNGGEVTVIEVQVIGHGPFKIKHNGQKIYRFEYNQDGVAKKKLG